MFQRFARVSLAVRAMVLVTVALLPLGVIAIWQTDRIIREERALAEQALLAVTEKAAAQERQVIERAIGAAAAVGNTARSLLDRPQTCSDTLQQFERGSELYNYAGFRNADGEIVCSSDAALDVQTKTKLQELIDGRTLGLYVQNDPYDPSSTVLVVATPAFEAANYAGHLRLHIPSSEIENASDALKGERPLGLVTFNEDGEILTSERELERARAFLPNDVSLKDLRQENAFIFYALSGGGEERAYAVVPLVSGSAYALATWNTQATLLQKDSPYWRTIILAVLMWLASLLVLFLIMQLLVIRGAQQLHRQVKAFRTNRTLPSGQISGRGEMYDLEMEFRDLTDTVLRDEAHLEDVAHEKNVLLKEVHHRVKNNLQLINSIINMILRGSPSDETQNVVRRLQDRIMALASVHRSIYQAQSMDRVDAADIVREIVNQGVSIGLPSGSDVDVDVYVTPVALYPDQAMPLSLLVSEAVTNALKYVGGPSPHIDVRLTRTAPQSEPDRRIISLVVSNTVADVMKDDNGTGLGSQLVRAFSHQLDGQLKITDGDGLHKLEVTFEMSEFEPDPADVARAAE